MSLISLVLFDVNGVLYEYDKTARLTSLARLTGQDPAAIDRSIWGSGFEDEGDAGSMDAQAYLHGFGEQLGRAVTTQEWADTLRSSLTPIPAMLTLAARVASRARVGVLTNNNLLVRDRMDQLYPRLRPIFGDAICVSSEFHARKPDPDVYRLCLARLGAPPETCLFIDDSTGNVAGAERAGLLAHRHINETVLTARLTELGLL